MLDLAHEQALEIINSNRDKVELMTQMLMEFETLDRDDVHEIIAGTWDIEKKRARLKATEDLQKKSPVASVSKEPNRPTPAPQTSLKNSPSVAQLRGILIE